MRHTSYFALLTLIVMAASALFNTRPVTAQSGIALENVGASYRFGEQITFSARIKASITIQSVAIVVSDEAEGFRQVEPLSIQADGSTEFRLDTKQNVLRPFTDVKWNYQFTLPDGSMVESESFFLRYADNRFNWQTLELGALRLNWYAGDPNFGQAALDAAQAGLGSISSLLPLNLAQPVEIFIYANADDLRGTLVLGGEDWVAGHADPALGVVMVVVEPGAEQAITMEQRIPHELTHVMMYRNIGAGYHNIPAWLREGTATLAETYPNADYDRALTNAVASHSLMQLKELCISFPSGAGQAFLAYAESRSFTNYLRDTYGSAGLLKLVSTYADGVDCERGTERAFGVSLSNLETKWRSSVLGQNAFLSILQSISPYLVLLCLVLLIPFIGILTILRKRK
ncbi:MAG TPA: peptidase MA family metallohydrolase [Anaerolineales bacterium]|nr:peptidase MA family metallohydrolase [Anaerolineales bacterium]